MVFISFIWPILESIVSVILTYLELVKSKFNVKITEMNLQIKKLADPEDEKPKYQIGFAIPTNDENEEDIDENI